MKGIVTATLLALIAAGCEQRPHYELPSVNMKIGRRNFQLEVARTLPQQQKGLMQRDSMPSDHGMIFVFHDEQPQGFWMKNTRIPLDILYLDSRGRIVSIHQLRPYDLKTVPSAAPAQFAIELNKGAAAAAGVKVGDVLEIPPGARPQ